MRRKTKILLTLAIAILTFASLKAFVPEKFQDRRCYHREDCNNNHQSKSEH